MTSSYFLEVVHRYENWHVLEPCVEDEKIINFREVNRFDPGPIPKNREEQERYWRSRQSPNYVMTPPPLTLLRFSLGKNFDYHVEIPVPPKYDFKAAFEWIHSQTDGLWSATILADRSDRSKGVILYSFERKESAALFKLFNS